MDGLNRKKVAICETQPVTAEGLRCLVASSADLEWLDSADSIGAARDLVWLRLPDVLVVDKALGLQAIADAMVDLRGPDSRTAIVLWGVSISQTEALRLVQAGAKGVVRKSAPANVLLACLQSVASGVTWMEDVFFGDRSRLGRGRNSLTPRELQVADLIEQGFKNREIAGELGIRPGTVKIHLKHIFEKTGIRGRYGLALTGMREKGRLALLEKTGDSLRVSRVCASPRPETG